MEEYSPVTNPGFGGSIYAGVGGNLTVTWDIEYIIENIKETWS